MADKTEREKYKAGEPFDENKLAQEDDDAFWDRVFEAVERGASKNAKPAKLPLKPGPYYPDRDRDDLAGADLD